MRDKRHKKWNQECKQNQASYVQFLGPNFCNIFDLLTSRTEKTVWWPSRLLLHCKLLILIMRKVITQNEHIIVHFEYFLLVTIGIRKIATPKMPPMKIPLYEYSPLWKLPPVKITPQKFAPEKIAPSENYPQWNPLPNYKSYKWKKKQNYTICCLEESCAIQHPYILGLDTFFTEWKKSKNRTKAKIVKWHLLASCTSQGELKLGSQIIKFGKYVKLLNSQLSMHITLWILKKANSKMHASGRRVTIVYECGCVYWILYKYAW